MFCASEQRETCPGRKTLMCNDDWPYSWSEPFWDSSTYVLQRPPPCDVKCGDQLPVEIGSVSNASVRVAASCPDECFIDGRIVNESLRRLHRITGEHPTQPWFLAVGFAKPHIP